MLLRGTQSDSCGRNFISLPVYPIRRITGEGRAEVLRTWGPGFEQEGAGRVGTVGATQSVRGNYKPLEETNLTVSEGKHQFILIYILYIVQPVRRGRNVRGGEGVAGGGGAKGF